MPWLLTYSDHLAGVPHVLRVTGRGLETGKVTEEVRGAPGDFGGDKGGAPAEFQPSFRVRFL